MKIILLGLPGVGKGVQGKRLADWLGTSHVSVGDVVRDILTNNSPLAHEIRATFAGVWSPLPDTLAMKVATYGVGDHSNFVLDGFPRNVPQAKVALQLWSLEIAIFLNASEEVCRTRVLARERSDDGIEKLEARLMAERERLPGLVKFLRSQLPLIEVDTNRDMEEVFSRIQKLLRRKK